jgi:hypothetical protein
MMHTIKRAGAEQWSLSYKTHGAEGLSNALNQNLKQKQLAFFSH